MLIFLCLVSIKRLQILFFTGDCILKSLGKGSLIVFLSVVNYYCYKKTAALNSKVLILVKNKLFVNFYSSLYFLTFFLDVQEKG